MTHAALKDPSAAKVVECVRNALESHRKGLPEEWQDFIAEQVRDLSSAIAALSAMEGEDFHDRLYGMKFYLYLDPNGEGSEKVELTLGATIQEDAYFHPTDERPLYTAPPPQQAVDRSWLLDLVPEAQEFSDGMEDREWCAGFNSCRRMTLGNIERSALATHPTPSPGPQGGGEASAVVCLVTEKRYPHFAEAQIQLYNGYEPKIGDRFYLAAPPAHQPGEVEKSRIVGMDCGSSDQTNYVIACPCGRLHGISAASSALAPKEAGHGS